MSGRHHRSDARISIGAVIALAFVSSFIAFFTSNWLASEDRIYGSEFYKLGLWETCFRSFPEDESLNRYFAGCRWIFREEYDQIRGFLMPGFFVATQVLYTLGFVFLLMATVGTLAIELCFITDREAFAMKILSLLMLAAGTLCTIAVIIFGIKGDDREWMPGNEHNFLSWSFGLAVVGCICHWVACILFLVESRILYRRERKGGRNESRHHHHHPAFAMEPTNHGGHHSGHSSHREMKV